jgi:hypothetical protein
VLAGWTRFLPFALVAWLARRHCERFALLPGRICVQPYRGFLLAWTEKKNPGSPSRDPGRSSLEN